MYLSFLFLHSVIVCNVSNHSLNSCTYHISVCGNNYKFVQAGFLLFKLSWTILKKRKISITIFQILKVRISCQLSTIIFSPTVSVYPYMFIWGRSAMPMGKPIQFSSIELTCSIYRGKEPYRHVIKNSRIRNQGQFNYGQVEMDRLVRISNV